MNFQEWAREDAFPLWLRAGVDRERGGFHERLTFDLLPIEEPRRARLTARQMYCFLIAHSMGVPNACQAALHGLDFLRRHLLRPDGSVVMSIDLHDMRTDRRFDPYDDAFVLFALCHGARVLPGDADWEETARGILAALERHRHPVIGFEEPLPLKANPHMHLLEAFLAWEQVSNDGVWAARSDEMVRLFLSHLAVGEHGAVSEFFDAQWQPLETIVVEPGHQFEWAWLLMRWADARGSREVFDKGRQLVAFAEQHGVVEHGDLSVAVNSLAADTRVADAAAKLWPQTERIKALTYLREHRWATDADRELTCVKLPQARAALAEYLDVRPRGLWHESLSADGCWERGAVKASSLYHIVCAIEQMDLKS